MNAVLPVNREVMEAMARRFERLGGALPTHRAGHFDRERLPDPLTYYTEQAGLVFKERRGRWRTTRCEFHGGSDSMRVNVESGAFCCMSCGASGGDVLAYHMRLHRMGFVEAARALGAWRSDPRGQLTRIDRRPASLSAADALALIRTDVESLAIEAARAAKVGEIEPPVREYLIKTAARVLSVIRSREATHAV
jgi:hypothetical protein